MGTSLNSFSQERNGQMADALIYGSRYSILNGYGNWTGGFLDTRGSGCEDNVYCVSTASTPLRDGHSGLWVIKSATGKPDGTPVNCNDKVYLVNQYGSPTYLDTRGSGCQDNALCVSTATTANRDSGSGTWLIIPDQCETGTIPEGTPVRLLNGFANFSGGFLDTRGAGCQDNLYCVSTSANYNRDSGSTMWKFSSHL
jgi:ribosomal protein S27E